MSRNQDLRDRAEGPRRIELVPVSLAQANNWPNLTVQKILVQPAVGSDPILRLELAAVAYQSTADAYMNLVRKSDLYAGLGSTGYNVTPYRDSGTMFRLTAEIGEPVEIELTTAKVLRAGVPTTLTKTVFIPANVVSTLEIQLGLGENFLRLKQGARTASFKVHALRLASLAYTVASKIHDQFVNPVEELHDDLLAPVSAKLVEHTLPFTDLIPPARVLRILGVRKATQALFLHASTERGVSLMLSGILGSTPVIREVPREPDVVDVGDGGDYLIDQVWATEVGVWLPASDVVRREALIRLAATLFDVELVSARQREVVLRMLGSNIEQIHGFENPDFSRLSLDDVLLDSYAGSVAAEATNVRAVTTCRVRFTDDVVLPMRCWPVRAFDCGIPLDAGAAFDSDEPFNIGSVGWQPINLTADHWDDTAFVGPVAEALHPDDPALPACAWQGGRPMTSIIAATTEHTITDSVIAKFIATL